MNTKKLTILSAVLLTAAFTSTSNAQTTTTIVDDNYAVDGTATIDAAYFGSSTSGAIETNINSFGLVSGTSGRQIHAIFPEQTLDVGDTLTVAIDFVTPNSVASTNEDLRIGLFDHLGRGDEDDGTGNPGALFQNTSYSSSNTNANWSGLPGFYSEIDVESDDTATDMDIRLADPSETGRHISTSAGFTGLGSGPDLGYVIGANTAYTYTMTLAHNIDGNLEITVQLSDPNTDFAANTHIVGDDVGETTFFDIGLLAMGSSSGAFGVSTSAGDADNGIDITSLNIDYFDADGVADGGGNDPVEGEETCYVIPTPNGNTSIVCL